ncbi:tRNA-intron lyase [Halobellus limi]|uniref:tRNA-splicing endonuclease n=1 Tax=Halobellus limi TaxID=699433 RepID=A0A1H5X7W7_9EURY|nr:tRNA-intron lyase [Halobellus limi]QCC46232.1 tRNA-intron lyase [Halobellus limi]SEG07477.1 tRNA-intron endonuclease [Halobellus limi]
MDGTLADGVVRVGGDARQRFYDARGYGRPLDRNRIELAPVEAAHLLSRGDLDAVVDESAAPDGDAPRLGFREFLVTTGATLRFAVYKDLRDRGFYLSPAREDWPGVDDAVAGDTGIDFVVYPRGKGPWDDEVAYRIRVAGERERISAASLGDVVLAIVDEDGDLTYFETDGDPAIGEEGSGEDGREPGTLPSRVEADLPSSVEADLLDDRVVCYEAAEELYEDHFYGQRLFGRNAESGPLQLSLVEGAYLAQRGVVDVDPDAVVALGRDVEGERFDRRLRTYAALRDRGVVPKSGFKFGSDFRVYEEFTDVDSLSHSTDLVRVGAPNHAFYPRDLSLDVRLAGGVRKRMVFALTAANGEIDWLSVARVTP